MEFGVLLVHEQAAKRFNSTNISIQANGVFVKCSICLLTEDTNMKNLYILMLLGFLTGCGSDVKKIDVQPVEGVVTLRGKPIEGAIVTFAPEVGTLRPASGKTDQSGKYQLFTEGRFQGAEEGKYRVSISKVDVIGKVALTPNDPGYGKRPNTKTVQVTPARYGDFAKSGLSVVVKSGTNEIPFDLK
jgi:hypothetical protein